MICWYNNYFQKKKQENKNVKNSDTKTSNILQEFLEIKMLNRVEKQRQCTSLSSVNAVECHPPAAIST